MLFCLSNESIYLPSINDLFLALTLEIFDSLSLLFSYIFNSSNLSFSSFSLCRPTFFPNVSSSSVISMLTWSSKLSSWISYSFSIFLISSDFSYFDSSKLLSESISRTEEPWCWGRPGTLTYKLIFWGTLSSLVCVVMSLVASLRLSENLDSLFLG